MAWSKVQSAQKSAGIVTSTTLAYTSNVTSGNLLLCCVNSGGITTVPTSIPDSQGSFVMDKSQVQTTDGSILSIWSRVATATGANTVTINTASCNIRCVILEYTGLAGGALDQASGVQQDAVANQIPLSSPPSVTTTVNDTVILHVWGNGSLVSFVTPATNWTTQEEVLAGNIRLSVMDRIVTSTGTYTATQTNENGTSSQIMTILAAYGGSIAGINYVAPVAMQQHGGKMIGLRYV